jgi:hypothetical protein
MSSPLVALMAYSYPFYPKTIYLVLIKGRSTPTKLPLQSNMTSYWKSPPRKSSPEPFQQPQSSFPFTNGLVSLRKTSFRSMAFKITILLYEQMAMFSPLSSQFTQVTQPIVYLRQEAILKTLPPSISHRLTAIYLFPSDTKHMALACGFKRI